MTVTLKPGTKSGWGFVDWDVLPAGITLVKNGDGYSFTMKPASKPFAGFVLCTLANEGFWGMRVGSGDCGLGGGHFLANLNPPKLLEQYSATYYPIYARCKHGNKCRVG